jgi:hypothetical protein
VQDGERLLLQDQRRGGLLILPAYFRASARLSLEGDDSRVLHPHRLQGELLVATSSLDQRPAILDLHLDPTAVLSTAHSDGFALALDGDLLRLRARGSELAIDAQSGRIAPFSHTWGSTRLDFQLEAGAFSAVCAAADRSVGGEAAILPLLAEDLLMVLEREGLVATDNAARARAVLPTLFPWLRRLLPKLPATAQVDDGNAGFIIPDQAAPASNSIARLITLAAVHAHAELQQRLPAQTWPLGLLRGLAGLGAGRGEVFAHELAGLESSRPGPLGCLATARTLALIGHPLAWLWAERGLQSCNEAEAQRDFALLEPWAAELAPLLLAATRNLAALDQDRDWALATAQAMDAAQAGGGSSEAALAAGLRMIWGRGLAAQTRKWLQRLAPAASVP